MSHLRAQLPVAAIGVVAVLATLAVLATVRGIAPAFSLAVYLLAGFVFFVDLLDFLIRLACHRRRLAAPGWRVLAPPASVPLEDGGLTPRQKRLHLKPYALLLSVYNAEDDVDDLLERLAPFRDRLWMIDDASTDSTRLRLLDAGIPCLAGSPNRKKPGALRELLARLPAEIETVVILDPDTTVRNGDRNPRVDLETVLFDFQRSGMAALCPRVAVREDGHLARFQGLEYAISCCFGRKTLGDFSTNAGLSIYRRDALERTLERHSLSVYAEDFENSLILLGAGEGIYYDDRLVLETEAKRTWKGWCSQRVGWSFGVLSVYLRRLGEIRRVGRRGWMAAYHYMLYIGILYLLLHPVRVASVLVLAASFVNGLDELLGLGAVPDHPLTEPAYFLGIYLKYTVLGLVLLAVAVPREDRRRLLPAVPFYLFYQIVHIAVQTVGFGNWLSLRLAGRRIFRDHYQDEQSLRRQFREA